MLVLSRMFIILNSKVTGKPRATSAVAGGLPSGISVVQPPSLSLKTVFVFLGRS